MLTRYQHPDDDLMERAADLIDKHRSGNSGYGAKSGDQDT